MTPASKVKIGACPVCEKFRRLEYAIAIPTQQVMRWPSEPKPKHPTKNLRVCETCAGGTDT